ncbi:unnamed protein product [Mytilus edulis]|uniref:Uncharacterized protein n=1 Tax=Mytilus edulis TaxID=6550 RepID=A0A8S3TZK9_MYTED|nr:unnamed protein product [Mytilus edulis]
MQTLEIMEAKGKEDRREKEDREQTPKKIKTEIIIINNPPIIDIERDTEEKRKDYSSYSGNKSSHQMEHGVDESASKKELGKEVEHPAPTEQIRKIPESSSYIESQETMTDIKDFNYRQENENSNKQTLGTETDDFCSAFKPEDVLQKHVLVNYDGKLYPGLVVDIDDNEVYVRYPHISTVPQMEKPTTPTNHNNLKSKGSVQSSEIAITVCRRKRNSDSQESSFESDPSLRYKSVSHNRRRSSAYEEIDVDKMVPSINSPNKKKNHCIDESRISRKLPSAPNLQTDENGQSYAKLKTEEGEYITPGEIASTPKQKEKNPKEEYHMYFVLEKEDE